ncbi:MAG: hypothetical protein ACLT6Z_03910 [Coprobacillus cateniformis]
MAILIVVFIGTYLLNKNTPKPEGCEELSECGGCNNIACSHNTAHHKEEVKDEY